MNGTRFKEVLFQWLQLCDIISDGIFIKRRLWVQKVYRNIEEGQFVADREVRVDKQKTERQSGNALDTFRQSSTNMEWGGSERWEMQQQKSEPQRVSPSYFAFLRVPIERSAGQRCSANGADFFRHLSLSPNWSPLLADGFFRGWDFLVICLTVTNSIGGLLISVVIKYADNILKAYAQVRSLIDTNKVVRN